MKPILSAPSGSVLSASVKVTGFVQGTASTGTKFNLTQDIRFSLGNAEQESAGFVLAFEKKPYEDGIVFSFPEGLKDGKHLVKYPDDFDFGLRSFWLWGYDDTSNSGKYISAHSGELNIEISDSENRAAGTLTFYSEDKEVLLMGKFDLQK